jgi:hypothetical protein
MRSGIIILLCGLACACARQPVVAPPPPVPSNLPAGLPADFSGYWQRNYARDEDVNGALDAAYRKLERSLPQGGPQGAPAGPSSRDVDSLVALARLAELITRPDEIAISQTDNEITVQRKDDFTMLCAFYDGAAKATLNSYGQEVCGWAGKDLINQLTLPGGLQITHRFTVSGDRKELRIFTTIASGTSRVPFTINRFYKRYDRLPPDFHCIETLSMKRVCSIGPLSP